MAQRLRVVTAFLFLLLVMLADAVHTPLHSQIDAAASSPNILVVTSRTLKEYAPGGGLVSSVAITPDPAGEGGWSRDVAVDDLGRVHVYDGTFDPSLSSRDPVTGAWSWRKHAGWSTVNNVSFGGVAAYGNYVFATDMWTAGNQDPNARGLIRFDLSSGAAVRFYPTVDFIDVNLGLDGLLYGLQDEYTIRVFNPATLELVRSVSLADDVRAIAVDTNGDIYGASWSFRVHRFSSTGALVNSLDTAGNSTIDIDIDLDGRIVYGSRDGRVYLTNRQLSAPVWFDASPNSFDEAFVAFASLTPSPTTLTATAVSPTRIDLAWTDNSSTETAFELERRTGAAPFATIATLAANTTSYSDSGLEPDTQYDYRVRALLPETPTLYSNTASARTLPPVTGAPTNLVINVLGSTELELNWVDNTGGETAFEVARKTAAAAYQTVAVLSANVATYNNTGLQPGTQYTYRVRAITPQGPTAYSNEATSSTLPLQTLPPSDLSAAPVSSNSIELRWRDRSDVETAFDVERSVSGGSFAPLTTVGANVIRHVDTGLAPQTTYSYRVRAQFPSGPTSFSNPATAVTFAPGVQPPSNLTATAFSAIEVRIAWEDRSGNETGFEIERRMGAAAFAKVHTAAAGATSYADANLQPETIYAYRVRATTPGGPTGYSNEAATATPALQLNEPTGPTAVAVSHSQINLAWIDNSNLETSFQIERRIGTGMFSLLATVAADTTSHQDLGLTPETSYSYRVRAVRGSYLSTFSVTVTATTSPKPLMAPSGLTAGAVSSTEVRLAWRDESDDETGFQIQRKVSGGVYAPLTSVGAAAGAGSTVRYADSAGLTANTTYHYQVRAVKGGTSSSYSDEAQVTTTPPLPAAPTNLTAALTAATTVQLSWTDQSNNETGFSIERKAGVDGSFTFVGTTGADTPTFPDPGLAADTLYIYRVRAVGAAGGSDYTNDATTATRPAAPTNVTVAAGAAGQLLVAWADASQSETGFKVERKTSGGAFAQVATPAAGATGFTDTGLAAGTTYTYRVRAVNQGGDSLPSNEASRITLPAAPSALAAAALSSTQLRLTWTDGNPSPPAVKVERALNMVGPFTQVGVSAVGSTSFDNAGLSPNTAYYYRVRATNASGDSGYSDVTSAVTLPSPPATPGNFTATAVSGRSIQLSWQDNSSNETGFEVLRLPPQGGAYQLITTTGANAASYLDNTGLAGSSAYSYRLRAVNAGGGSPYTNAAATTLPDLPTAPTGLSGSALSAAQVQLTWTDASDNETGFQVQRRPEGGAFATITTTGPNATEYVNGSLTEGARYSYRVIAVNSQGESAPSAEVAVTTRPQSPGSLTATAGNRKIDLAWVDRSARESGFRIERHAGGGAFTAVATVAANVATYTDASVTAASAYTYRVIAVSADGDSEPSSSSSATPRNETPLAKLVITPKSLAFGTVKLTRTKQKTLKLTNKGKEPVMVTVGAIGAPFAVVSGGGAFTLAPKASRTVAVTFTPVAAGTAKSTLRITSTDPRAALKDIAANGKGI